MRHEELAPVLRVENTAAALEWYQRLGFLLEYERSTGPGFSRTVAVLKRGDLLLILSEGDEDIRPDASICLRVADVASIANEFNVPVQKALVGEHAELRDPDGNRIRVVSWNITFGGTKRKAAKKR